MSLSLAIILVEKKTQTIKFPKSFFAFNSPFVNRQNGEKIKKRADMQMVENRAEQTILRPCPGRRHAKLLRH